MLELSLANWQDGPYNRTTFGRMREIVPTARVSAGRTPLTLQAGEQQLDLDTPILRDGRSLGRFRDLLHRTYTDGLLVLHEGKIVAEHYPGDLDKHRTHTLFSVSKSLVGTVCAILVGQGQVRLDADVCTYVPELASSGYAGATVRHVLDMRSGIKFSEDYEDLNAEVRRIDQAVGWLPRDDEAPTRLYEYLPRLVAERDHGGHFEYRSCENDVLGWVCERAAGERMPSLLSRLLWSRIADYDADAGVDIDGTIFFDGGIATTLRDLARFGQVICQNGAIGHSQVIPRFWIEDTLAGDADSQAAFAASSMGRDHPGWRYRNQFWVPYTDRRVICCLGIHDQLVYIDLDAQAVVVKFSSQPTALNARLEDLSFALAEAAVRMVA